MFARWTHQHAGSHLGISISTHSTMCMCNVSKMHAAVLRPVVHRCTLQMQYCATTRAVLTSNTRLLPQAGDTPLHSAAWDGHTSAVELLLGAGADVDAQNFRVRPRQGCHALCCCLLLAG
jgi:hypothetical protein